MAGGEGNSIQVLTCIFLWCHGLVDDASEGCDPVQLVSLCLAGEEVFPVRGDNGEAIVPREVALCPRRQSLLDAISILSAAHKYLTLSKCILHIRREREGFTEARIPQKNQGIIAVHLRTGGEWVRVRNVAAKRSQSGQGIQKSREAVLKGSGRKENLRA